MIWKGLYPTALCYGGASARSRFCVFGLLTAYLTAIRQIRIMGRQLKLLAYA